MAATSTTMTARNAIRFPEACVIRNSPFLPLSCYGKGAMPPFFSHSFPHYTRSLSKRQGKTEFSPILQPCRGLPFLVE